MKTLIDYTKEHFTNANELEKIGNIVSWAVSLSIGFTMQEFNIPITPENERKAMALVRKVCLSPHPSIK